jgi:hypothetical protein
MASIEAKGPRYTHIYVGALFWAMLITFRQKYLRY